MEVKGNVIKNFLISIIDDHEQGTESNIFTKENMAEISDYFAMTKVCCFFDKLPRK